MSDRTEIRVDLEAARALVTWKSLFADEVAARARLLAAESTNPERITLSQYQQAARVALRSLSAAILEGGASSGEHQSA